MATNRLAVTAALLLAGLALWGCGKEPAAQSPTSSPAGQRIKLAGIILQDDQFFRLVLFGMRDAARKAGVELLEGSSRNKPEKEIQLVDTYVAQGVDAIVISPLSKEGSVAALKSARDKGVKIIADSTPLGGDLPTAFVECSAADLGHQTGRAAREYIEKHLGGHAKIGIIAFKSQVPEQSDARTGGFKAELADVPGVEIVAEQDAWLPEMAVKRAGDMLTANPDIDVIYAANEGGTVGSVLAVKNAGRAGKVVVFGTDSSEQMLAMLQSPDDILQAVTSQRPVEIGRLAVETAIKAVRGEPVEKVTSLKGTLLSRTDPKGVAEFARQFKQWTQLGSE